ncbi:MAG: preprotein translocase subunit SecG [Phycisphaerae bacterium]
MLLAAAWYHAILAFLFAFMALILMVVILLQRGRGVGLAGAFGGAGGQAAFGAKTGDVLTWATIVLAAIFLLYTVGLNFAFRPMPAIIIEAPAVIAPTPAAAPAPATGGPAAPAPATDGPTAPVTGTPASEAGEPAKP